MGVSYLRKYISCLRLGISYLRKAVFYVRLGVSYLKMGVSHTEFSTTAREFVIFPEMAGWDFSCGPLSCERAGSVYDAPSRVLYYTPVVFVAVGPPGKRVRAMQYCSSSYININKVFAKKLVGTNLVGFIVVCFQYRNEPQPTKQSRDLPKVVAKSGKNATFNLLIVVLGLGK